LFLLVLTTTSTSCLRAGDIVWTTEKGEAVYSPFDCNRVSCRKTFSFEKGEELQVAEPHPEMGDNKVVAYEMYWIRTVKNKVYGWVPESKTTNKQPK
jgi:hypothetical protein